MMIFNNLYNRIEEVARRWQSSYGQEKQFHGALTGLTKAGVIVAVTNLYNILPEISSSVRNHLFKQSVEHAIPLHPFMWIEFEGLSDDSFNYGVYLHYINRAEWKRVKGSEKIFDDNNAEWKVVIYVFLIKKTDPRKILASPFVLNWWVTTEGDYPVGDIRELTGFKGVWDLPLSRKIVREKTQSAAIMALLIIQYLNEPNSKYTKKDIVLPQSVIERSDGLAATLFYL